VTNFNSHQTAGAIKGALGPEALPRAPGPGSTSGIKRPPPMLVEAPYGTSSIKMDTVGFQCQS